ncbi:MAG: DNA methyltransferase [Smithella sp.]
MANKYNSQTGDLYKKDILKMPEGYYSGDKPNPNLRAFVEKHIKEWPYNSENDDYDVPAFDKPIVATGATAIYNMHSYHQGKKPHDAIREYIQHYTKPGALVLDPFSGSGGTLLAALMDGRKAIAIDRSPAATFITKNYCTPVDMDELQKAFEELKRNVKTEIDWLYETRCERCGGKATTAYTVYSQVLQCPRCLGKLALFDCVEVDGETAQGKPKKINACPHCHKKGIVEEISTRIEKLGEVPVLVSYLCESGCRPARGERRHNDSNKKKRDYFERYDLGKIKEIGEKDIPYWYPKNRMMNAPEDKERWALLWRRGIHKGITHVKDFFTKRNLWALTIIRKYATINVEPVIADLTMAALTGSMLHLSRMSQHKEGGGGIMVGTFYIPPIFKERNAYRNLSDKLDVIIKAKDYTNTLLTFPAFVSTQSACVIGQISSCSIDYIFTDPPYADTVQYGELNFIWEAWLGFDLEWHSDEIIVNDYRGKTENDWASMMLMAMAECYRVLKPGRWCSLCYHDTSEGTWALLQDIMAEVGFIADKTDGVLFIDKQQKSYNQYTADKVNKRDLVINFRKPKLGEVTATVAITGDEDETTFNEKVRQIIRDYIGDNPGCSKDRIYDEVVSRMVRSGQMEAHDFSELLSQVADETKVEGEKSQGGRWYLKEIELVMADDAETAREDTAAEKVGAFIKVHLKKHPGNEGVHYSDIFENYIYAVKDKPRRQLVEFLPDYFYKTDQGTWRLPASEEEDRAKREARVKGLGRRVKRYIAQLEQGAVISDHERPNDSTLAEWLRHCKRSGLYEQGKLLYEKGGINLDNLTEEVMVNVEEDYQVCVRMLSRSGGIGGEKKQKRGAKERSLFSPND